MTHHASMFDEVVQVAPRSPEPTTAPPPSAPGTVLAIVTDPAVLRIAVLAVGIAALLLALATVL